jgi:exopolysaccharide biosynthesis polyprenyl glycosylphosphotransferase
MSAPSSAPGDWARTAGTAVLPARFEPGAQLGSGAAEHSRGPMWPQVASVALDLFLVSLNGAAIFYLRFMGTKDRGTNIPVGHYLGFLLLYAGLVGIFCRNQGLYKSSCASGPLDECFSIVKAVFYATLFLTVFIYLSGDKSISRLVVGVTGVLNAVTLPAWRFWRCEIVKHRVISGKDGRNVFIVGAGTVGHALARHFEENKHLGYVVKGFLDHRGNGDPRVIGEAADLSRLALKYFVDEVFVTIPSERQMVAQIVLEARRQRLDVKVVPEMFEGLGWRAPIRYIGYFPVMELLREPIPAFGLFIKRAIDVAGAMIGLALMTPALALAALAIKLDSPGPAIYCASRVGRKGRTFRCYKLRSMVVKADAIKEDLRELNERNGPFFKITKDPRITRVGRFLRKYSLDELPQLWNVLCGSMSLVGPRPHPLDDYGQYQLEHLRRLDVKPGLTGLWQVYARRDPCFERNIALDLEYIETWSLWLDAKILLKTLPAVLNGSGA